MAPQEMDKERDLAKKDIEKAKDFVRAAEVRKKIAHLQVKQEKIKESIIYIERKFTEKEVKLQAEIKAIEDFYKERTLRLKEHLKELENEKKERIKDLESQAREFQKEAADFERR